ncbi:MAG: Hsp20/alpha crystallin family protein [Bacteroidota bacterium]|nr:Hsp20/alpha crystallin family protein [Bacteroidota bacterium]
MTLIRFNGKNENYPAFSNLFENFFNDDYGFNGRIARSTPAVNVIEEKENFKIEVAAPGLKKKDFKVNLENDVLTISSNNESKNEVKKENYTKQEFCFDSFSRSFTLPDAINSNKIDANYSEGVLTISLPLKEEAKVQASREIEIA